MPLKLSTIFDKAVTDRIANKFKDIESKLLSKEEARNIGTEIVSEMKQLISRGISPIKGNGRFPAYKNPKDGYPSSVRGSHPRKRNTPVNLNLTGDMLRDLKAKVSPKGIEIGYSKQSEVNKELGHREGTNGQPKRPTIPLARSGEEFAARIQDIYLRVVNKNIKKL